MASPENSDVLDNADSLIDPFTRPPPVRLFHYSSPAGLLGIVRSRSIWATDARFLNDSRELKHALAVMNAVLRQRQRQRNSSRSLHMVYALIDLSSGLRYWRRHLHTFVASLSEERDLLSQWRAYCPATGGFALGFNGRGLRRILAEHGYLLAPCIYSPEHQRALIGRCIDIALEFYTKVLHDRELQEAVKLASNVFAVLAMGYAPLLKHPSFSEEREWRIIPKPHSRRLSIRWWQSALRNPNRLAELERLTDPATPKANELDYREGRSVLVPYVNLSLESGRKSSFPLDMLVVGPSHQMELSRESARGFLDAAGLESVRVMRSRSSFRPG